SVEKDDAPTFLEPHGAGQLHVRAEDPGGPATVLLLPMGAQALKEGVGLHLVELFAPGACQGGARSTALIAVVATVVPMTPRAPTLACAFGVDALAVRRVEHHQA